MIYVKRKFCSLKDQDKHIENKNKKKVIFFKKVLQTSQKVSLTEGCMRTDYGKSEITDFA